MRLLFSVVAALAVQACIASTPKVMLRLGAQATQSAEAWRQLCQAITNHAGCCDEVWFSTGVTYPPLAWHDANVDRLRTAFADVRAAGLSPSLQFHATIGHTDDVSGDFSAKTWRGFVGRGGLESKSCSCPREPAFLVYLREVAERYAALKPRSCWIDDDLRLGNHGAVSPWSMIPEHWVGCWCSSCLEAFNRKTGSNWSRETLDAAMKGDASLLVRWEAFSTESICGVARVIAEAFARLSPETKMGYQFCYQYDHETIRQVLRTLSGGGSRRVCARVGGSAWDDVDPHEPILKAFRCAWTRRILGNPAYADEWCVESESWPRTYGMRTAQSVLLESLISIAYGMDSTSYFNIDPHEPLSLHERIVFVPLAAGMPSVKRYAEICEGTRPCGFRSDKATVRRLYDFALSGIPVLPGDGCESGELSEQEMMVEAYRTPSAQMLAIREDFAARAKGPTLVVRTPFLGLVVPRANDRGELRTVVLLNPRIDRQEPVELALRGVSCRCSQAVWHELRRESVRLPLVWQGETAMVCIGGIDPWNAGWLELIMEGGE